MLTVYAFLRRKFKRIYNDLIDRFADSFVYKDFYIMLMLRLNLSPDGHMTFIQCRINVDATACRCIDVDATLSRRCVLVVQVLQAPYEEYYMEYMLSYSIK